MRFSSKISINSWASLCWPILNWSEILLIKMITDNGRTDLTLLSFCRIALLTCYSIMQKLQKFSSCIEILQYWLFSLMLCTFFPFEDAPYKIELSGFTSTPKASPSVELLNPPGLDSLPAEPLWANQRKSWFSWPSATFLMSELQHLEWKLYAQ